MESNSNISSGSEFKEEKESDNIITTNNSSSTTFDNSCHLSSVTSNGGIDISSESNHLTEEETSHTKEDSSADVNNINGISEIHGPKKLDNDIPVLLESFGIVVSESEMIPVPGNHLNAEPFDASVDNDGSVSSETNASLTTVIPFRNKDDSAYQEDTSLKSTTESLRQLSLQISGLVNDAEVQALDSQDVTIIELERRNNELASLLEKEKQKSFEQTSRIEELKKTVEAQEAQIQSLQKLSITDSNGTEIQGLREQLQVHIQTIGILVAEKSELQTNLSHTSYALEQKSGEVSEFEGRLDACRDRIRDLESSNQEMKNQVAQLLEEKEKDAKQISSLQNNYTKLSKMCDEMRASAAELNERLSVRTEENQKLNAELTEAKRQYELAQVHIEQLKGNSTDEIRNQLEELQTSYNDCQHEIRLLQATSQQAENEKQQLELEYKSYVRQLTVEMDALKEDLENELKKNETLLSVKNDLETKLKTNEGDPKLSSSLQELEKEKTQLIKELDDAKEIKKQLEEKCFNLVKDNGQLSQLIIEQSSKLEAMETALDRNNTFEIDTSKLLQSMQSDKIAASRALSQNKQLKEQLEELQNGFIMMSNKKLELTEKLEKELHIKKTLQSEISHLGEELSAQKESLLTKQREIDALRTEVESPCKPVVNDGTANVQIEHSQNQSHAVDCSYHNNNNATSEIEMASEVVEAVGEANLDKNLTSGKAKVNSIEDTPSFEDGIPKETSSASKNTELDGPHVISSPQSNTEVSFKAAHEALEKRFFKCMKDLAAMTDEKQNLEHLVQQLQLETEAVGDYITIYQFQRGVMKQQMQELRQEVDLLKTEKQEIMSKLSKLHKLIQNLAEDKNFSKEGFLDGISSIINHKEMREEGVQEKRLDGKENVESAVDSPDPIAREKPSKNETVRQIIEILGEMETSRQFDVSVFNKLHPCSHCSGKLITI